MNVDTQGLKYFNGKEVKYNKYKDDSIIPSKSGVITKKLLDASTKVFDRLYKLNSEFKAGYSYELTKDLKEKNMVDSNDDLVNGFRTGFYKVINSSGKAINYVHGDKVDTAVFKALVTTALSDLDMLQKFAMQDANKCNSLFEKALYDTNSEGIASGFAMMATGFLSLFFSDNNKHEFVDKIEREITDFNTMLSLVSELEVSLLQE